MVEQTIYKWIHRYEPFAKNEQGEVVTQADVKAIQRRIAELEMENEILKKATAILDKRKSNYKKYKEKLREKVTEKLE